MIQFNLLPDVKMQYISARNIKRMVVVLSVLTAAASMFILVLLFLATNVFQKMHISNLSDDIKRDIKKLQNEPDLNKVLTVQNQLKSLPSLHNQKPVTSRMFTYLAQITPDKLSIAKLDANFNDNTIKFTGTADSLVTINKFVDTLKFTNFAKNDSKDQKAGSEQKAFSNVVLSSFGRNDKESTYSVTLKYDQAIFNSSNEVTLTVPKIITTRSQTEKPTDLFKPEAPKAP